MEETHVNKTNVIRRKLFTKHDRHHSDSNHSVCSVSSQEKRSSGVFSFFKWFKKGEDSNEIKNVSLPASPTLRRNQSMSCGSLLSTATVSSFSFVNPVKYRPNGMVSQRQIQLGPETDTYRNRIKQRDQFRENDKNISLKKKYKLLGSSSTIYHSVENVSTCARPVPVCRSSSLGRKKRKAPLPPSEIQYFDMKRRDGYVHRRTFSDSVKDMKKVHVKGKRKAPPPPTPLSSMNNTLSRSLRKKRPAPNLPFNSEEKSRLLHSLEKLKAHAEIQSILSTSPVLGPRSSISNDILKLESGVLKSNKENVPNVASTSRSVTPSSPVSPRPWYKRQTQSQSEKIRHKDSKEDWLCEGNIQPRKNSMPEYDLRNSAPSSSTSINSNRLLSHIVQDQKSFSKSFDSNNKTSLPDSGIKHSLSNISCNSNSSSGGHSSKFSFFSRNSDEKRRSQISMLANISALDREAAEIIEREHKRQRELAEAENAKYYSDMEIPVDHEYTEIENDTIEPKRSSAKELISLFNAIGNVTRVTVNTAFFTKDSASNLFGKNDKFTVNCQPSPSSKRNERFKKIESFDELENYSESPRMKRANPPADRSKLRLGFGEPYKPQPAGTNSRDENDEDGVVIEEIIDDKPRSSASIFESNKAKYHRSPSPSIPTIVELSEHSSVTTPASTINPASEFSSLASTPVSPQTKIIPPSLNTKQSSQILQYVWTCPQCTLENLKWKFVCDACNFFRPFSIHMKPRDMGIDSNRAHSSSIPSTEARIRETSILDTDASNDTSNDHMTNGPGFCRPSTSNIKDSGRRAPYYMSDVIKSSDKQKVLADSIKDMPTTSIMATERKVNQTEQLTTEVIGSTNFATKDTTNQEVEEMRRARLAFFERTNNTKDDDTDNSLSSIVLDSHAETSYEKPDLKKLKETLKEMKSSLPQQTSSASTGTGETINIKSDYDIKPFVKFDMKAMAVNKNKSSQNVSQSKEKVALTELVAHSSKSVVTTNNEDNKTRKNNNNKTKESRGLSNIQVTELKNDTENKIDKKIELSEVKKEPNKKVLDAINKTNEIDKEFDDNSLDRIKLEDQKKAEIYLLKSKTIIEDIFVKKPPTITSSSSNKVSISVQTNSSVVKKSQIESNNSNRDAYNVTVPVVHEDYKILKHGRIITSLSKKNKIMGIGTFQLMKSKDFANIDVLKTGRQMMLTNGHGGGRSSSHMYANVSSPTTDDDSLSLSSATTCTSSTNCTSQVSPVHNDDKNSNLIRSKCFADFKARFVSNNSNVNTVAVNRLLKRLEAAIANGEHHKAASLAKELARLKIQCSVTRQQLETEQQSTSTTKHILINMYVEDKVSHQGPIPLSVLPSMTVGQLKHKLEIEYEIPSQVQKWILGKNLGTNENATLTQMGVIENGTPVFLYLVSPESHQSSNNSFSQSSHPSAEVLPGPSAPLSPSVPLSPSAPLTPSGPLSPDVQTPSTSFGTFNSAESSRASSLERDDPKIEEELTYNEDEPHHDDGDTTPDLPPFSPVPPNGTLAIGWKCPLCTLMNSPTRPGCAACNRDRPDDYQIPKNYIASPNEMNRLITEENIEKEVAAQKIANYEKLVLLEHSDLVLSTTTFECPVCLMECVPNNGAVLRECLHSFCKQCLIHTVEYNTEAVVKCPYRDRSYACDSTLQDREIKALVPPELYEQQLGKSVAHAEAQIRNAFHCKTPDCKGWCIFEDNVNIFHCPVCKRLNCLTCQAIHDGLNCKQYQDHLLSDSDTNVDARRTREMLEDMVTRGEAMYCPQCHILLMKKWGCDWLRCSMCKTEICWVTRGHRWGPNGKGDISAGCKCGINGIKCHPKCNYCH